MPDQSNVFGIKIARSKHLFLFSRMWFNYAYRIGYRAVVTAVDGPSLLNTTVHSSCGTIFKRHMGYVVSAGTFKN